MDNHFPKEMVQTIAGPAARVAKPRGVQTTNNVARLG